jgi:uncharacterized protein DUF3303
LARHEDESCEVHADIFVDTRWVLAEFSLMWSDLMELSTAPALEDEKLSEVLKRIGQ